MDKTDKSSLANIFLDFLNRDSRQIYGVFDNYDRNSHIDILIEALNVAVFLALEYCIVPPGFIAECNIVQEVLFKRRPEFLKERLIRLPMKEQSWDLFFEKKIKEYRPFKSLYEGLYDPSIHASLKKHSASTIQRSSNIGKEIVESWEEGPDKNGLWKSLIMGVSTSKLELIRTVPRSIYDTGVAVTWQAIKNYIPGKAGVVDDKFRQAVQYHYFSIYIREYQLRIISEIPFARISFCLEVDDLYYNYDAFRYVLSCLKLWDLFKSLSGASLIAIRHKSGYFEFRNAFRKISADCKSKIELETAISHCVDNLNATFATTKNLSKYDSLRRIYLPKNGIALSEEEIDSVTERLNAFSTEICKVSSEIEDMDRSITKVFIDQAPTVAFFVALPMERDILIKSFCLENTYPDKVWEGRINSTKILLYSSLDAGRVRAAVETASFLEKYHINVNMLIITGIAGGFKEEGVSLGDILVAKDIVDLSQRKIKENTGDIEFRPNAFKTDSRVHDFLNSGSFNYKKWKQMVIITAKWPDHSYPSIRFGPVATVDEVVRNAGWMKQLSEVWPKLIGVETEAGGVCQAADQYNIKVTLIRGVSDLVEPAEEEWRIRAMKTVACLLKNLDYEALLRKGDNNG